ncbi:MAG: putative helicase, partial [uncultured Campylobacterales bacterium]
PFKLAWAITIHKSQGKTFEKLVIDLERGSFAHGQTYVAFSRATSLDGIVLKRAIRSSDIKMDYMIKHFLNDAQNGLGQKSLF